MNLRHVILVAILLVVFYNVSQGFLQKRDLQRDLEEAKRRNRELQEQRNEKQRQLEQQKERIRTVQVREQPIIVETRPQRTVYHGLIPRQTRPGRISPAAMAIAKQRYNIN